MLSTSGCCGRLTPVAPEERASGCCCFCWRSVSFTSGERHTHSAASPAPTRRIQGVQSAFTGSPGSPGSPGAGIGCCDGTSATGCSFGTTSATGVAASATASVCRDCLAARSSSKRLSCLAFLAAAPARPAATFLGSFDLAVGEAATGTGAGVVTLSNPSVDSVWVFTQALCAGVVWSASIFWRDVGIIHIMRTMSKSAVPQCG